MLYYGKFMNNNDITEQYEFYAKDKDKFEAYLNNKISKDFIVYDFYGIDDNKRIPLYIYKKDYKYYIEDHPKK